MPVYRQRGVDKCVSVHDAVTQKFRVVKRGNKFKNSFLFLKLKIGLKAHYIVRLALGVFAP